MASDRPLTVVCLHGLGPAGPSIFDAAAREWRRAFDVCVLPFPGWDGTPTAARAHYLPTALARHVEREVDAERFAVVGYSWGGTVAARLDPTRLRALVLVDTAYQSNPEPPKTYEELLEQFAGSGFPTPEVLAAGFEGVTREPGWQALDGLRDVPILLLVSTEPYVERRDADVQRFRERAPHADVRVIEGATHDVLNSKPGTIELVAEWLRAHRDPR